MSNILATFRSKVTGMVTKQNAVLLVALCVTLILFLGCSSAPAAMLDTSDAILYDFIELYPYDAEGYNQAVEDGGYDSWGANPLPKEQALKYGIYKSLSFTIKSGQKIEITIRSKYPASTNRWEPPIYTGPVTPNICPIEWQGPSACIRMDVTAVKNFGDAWETTLTQRHPQKVSGEYVVSIANGCTWTFHHRSEVTEGGITMRGKENDHLWVEYTVRYASK